MSSQGSLALFVGNCNWKQFGWIYDVETEIKLEACLSRVYVITHDMMAIITEIITIRTKSSSWKISIEKTCSDREWKEVEEFIQIYSFSVAESGEDKMVYWC